MTIAARLIGVFGILRAVVPGAWLVVLLTWPVGIGMGLGNALAPIAVRETVPDRPATGTGVYTTGIQIGSTVSAALAVPLAAVLGGWRGALIAFSVVACADRRRLGRARARTARRTCGRRRSSRGCRGAAARAWLLVAIFALDGVGVLRAQRLAPRRVRRARLERRDGGRAARRDEPDRHPRVVRRARGSPTGTAAASRGSSR